MNSLKVDVGHAEYPIVIADDFKELQNVYNKKVNSKKALIITDTNVDKLYSQEVMKLLDDINVQIEKYVFKAGEKRKNLNTIKKIYSKCIESNLDRSSCIIALGGGVVGDIAGFVASTFMRGISFVQVPTTLLAQVDSSVGGKTGFDFEGFKNIVGSFYQPKFVYVNTVTLKTLPKRQFKTGLAEVLKYGMIRDKDFFLYLKENMALIKKMNAHTLSELIKRSCEIKVEIVSKDEKESGVRALLNFGHTIGHAVESASNFKLLHGEAISIGMAAASKLALCKGMIDEEQYNEVLDILKDFGLPTKVKNIEPEEVFKNVQKDKKFVNELQRFILLREVGEAYIDENITKEEIMKVINELY